MRWGGSFKDAYQRIKATYRDVQPATGTWPQGGDTGLPQAAWLLGLIHALSSVPKNRRTDIFSWHRGRSGWQVHFPLDRSFESFMSAVPLCRRGVLAYGGQRECLTPAGPQKSIGPWVSRIGNRMGLANLPAHISCSCLQKRVTTARTAARAASRGNLAEFQNGRAGLRGDAGPLSHISMFTRSSLKPKTAISKLDTLEIIIVVQDDNYRPSWSVGIVIQACLASALRCIDSLTP